MAIKPYVKPYVNPISGQAAKPYVNPISGRASDLRDNPGIRIADRSIRMPYVFVHEFEGEKYILFQIPGARPHKVVGQYAGRVGEDYDMSQGDAVRVDDGQGRHLARFTRIEDADLEKKVLESFKSPIGQH